MVPESHQDNAAFGQVVLPELPVLRGVAYRLCRNEDQARDLVQDTLEKALIHFDRFVPGTQFRSWLIAIMRNTFTDGWRKANTRPELVGLAHGDGVAAPAPEAAPAWQQIDVEAVRIALVRVPEPLRTTLDLYVNERLSYANLAARLKVKPITVGTRLLRARRCLRKLLADELVDGDQ
jgi:RNA polymerase sigma-70 factor (ECF subfamily)